MVDTAATATTADAATSPDAAAPAPAAAAAAATVIYQAMTGRRRGEVVDGRESAPVWDYTSEQEDTVSLLDRDVKWISCEAGMSMGMTDQAMALLDESEEQSVLFITPRSSVVSAISEHLSKAAGPADKHDK
jgi:hypothetical protein